jgi:hypothetical protein
MPGTILQLEDFEAMLQHHEEMANEIIDLANELVVSIGVTRAGFDLLVSANAVIDNEPDAVIDTEDNHNDIVAVVNDAIETVLDVVTHDLNGLSLADVDTLNTAVHQLAAIAEFNSLTVTTYFVTVNGIKYPM